jgi:hypothetical protein
MIDQSEYNDMKIQSQHKTYTPQAAFQIFVRVLQRRRPGSICKTDIRARGDKAKLKHKNSPDVDGGGDAYFSPTFLGEGSCEH